jgi:TPR repeat protein
VKTYKEEGTNFKEPSFYLDYAKQCTDVQYKIVALEKAVQYGADEETEFDLAELKLSNGKEDSVDVLQRLAEKGNVNALLRLAKIYEQGSIVAKDYSKEIECLNKAISNNSAEGMYQLGRLYMLGWGEPKSKAMAVDMFEKASQHNHEKANYQLYAVYYRENREQLALSKLKKAVDSGYVPAMYEYALHLLYGEHMKEDISQAVRLLEECALHGDAEAIEKLSYIYSVGYKVPRDKLKALEWQDKLAGG